MFELIIDLTKSFLYIYFTGQQLVDCIKIIDLSSTQICVFGMPGDGKSEKPVKTVDDDGKAAKKPAKAKKDAAAAGSDAPAKAPKAKKKKDTEAAAE